MTDIQRETISTTQVVRRLETCQRSLSDFDIQAPDDELIIRNTEEYLLIKHFRAMKLDQAKADASLALKQNKTNA